MVTIVRELLFAAKRERFSCDDQTLLARCLRYIQCVLKLDSGHPCYGQLTAVKKNISCIVGSSVQLIEMTI